MFNSLYLVVRKSLKFEVGKSQRPDKKKSPPPRCPTHLSVLNRCSIRGHHYFRKGWAEDLGGEINLNPSDGGRGGWWINQATSDRRLIKINIILL